MQHDQNFDGVYDVQHQKKLSRAISLIENQSPGYEEILSALKPGNTPVIGITGPPGAGKSTLTNALLKEMVDQQKKVAVLCVDPSSPFNLGALLGDRIRMSDWYNHPNVFIRSLASRGSLGGLHPAIIEITGLLQSACFDYIIIETIGVGQSEVEIAGLADVTLVVLVPEAGDEIQTMKAGLMEIADLFVVNKADRPEADLFVKNLRLMLAPAFAIKKHQIPVIKTVAILHTGIAALFQAIETIIKEEKNNDRKYYLLAEKAYHLIEKERMKGINKTQLMEKIKAQYHKPGFNLYNFVKNIDV